MTCRPAAHWRLLLTGLLLLTAGTALLALGLPATEPSAVDRAGDTRTPQPVSTGSRPASVPAPSASVSSAPSDGRLPNRLPLSGEGLAGDRVIQQVLDGTSPSDLPPSTARRLVALATRIWIAETTGTGRDRWPDYFTEPVLRAPYKGVRVQAAIARRDSGRDDRAVVCLVWAGTALSGENEDGRPATVSFERHHNGWNPVR